MVKSTKAFIAVFVIGIVYAFFALCTFPAMVMAALGFDSRFLTYFVMVCYIGGNALFGGAIGALSGIKIARRFYAPIVHLIVLALSSYINFVEGAPYAWACVGATIGTSFICTLIFAVLTARRKRNQNININYN